MDNYILKDGVSGVEKNVSADVGADDLSHLVEHHVGLMLLNTSR